jgi:hypothetical protein
VMRHQLLCSLLSSLVTKRPLNYCLCLCVPLKLQFWTSGPNSWISKCQVRPLFIIHQIKRHGEGQRKKIYYTLGHAAGRGKVSTQFIFGHLQGTDMSLASNRQRIRTGGERCA